LRLIYITDSGILKAIFVYARKLSGIMSKSLHYLSKKRIAGPEIAEESDFCSNLTDIRRFVQSKTENKVNG
jgi:hypothetical protein